MRPSRKPSLQRAGSPWAGRADRSRAPTRPAWGAASSAPEVEGRSPAEHEGAEPQTGGLTATSWPSSQSLSSPRPLRGRRLRCGHLRPSAPDLYAVLARELPHPHFPHIPGACAPRAPASPCASGDALAAPLCVSFLVCGKQDDVIPGRDPNLQFPRRRTVTQVNRQRLGVRPRRQDVRRGDQLAGV